MKTGFAKGLAVTNSSGVCFLQLAQHTPPLVPTLQRGNAEPDAGAPICTFPRWSVGTSIF